MPFAAARCERLLRAKAGMFPDKRANSSPVLIVSSSVVTSSAFPPPLCRKTWKPPNTFAGCAWPDSSFIKLTRAACKLLLFFVAVVAVIRYTPCPVPVSLFRVVMCMRLLGRCASSLLRSSSPLPSERSVTPCLLKAPRSPFSLCPFPASQCSLVPLCLLIRGEQRCQPPPAAQSANS